MGSADRGEGSAGAGEVGSDSVADRHGEGGGQY